MFRVRPVNYVFSIYGGRVAGEFNIIRSSSESRPRRGQVGFIMKLKTPRRRRRGKEIRARKERKSGVKKYKGQRGNVLIGAECGALREA